MKTIFYSLLIFSLTLTNYSSLTAQLVGDFECGVPSDLPNHLGQTLNNINDLACGNTFRVHFYFIRDLDQNISDDNVMANTPDEYVDLMVNHLNNHFAFSNLDPIDSPIEYFDDFSFISTEDKWEYLDLPFEELNGMNANDLWAAGSKCSALNIYVKDYSLPHYNPSFGGEASTQVFTERTFMYVRTNFSNSNPSEKALVHEMGHVFGLRHTFNLTNWFRADTVSFWTPPGPDPAYLQMVSPANPYGEQCANYGDWICDTYPAARINCLQSGCVPSTNDIQDYYMPNDYFLDFDEQIDLVKWPIFTVASEPPHANHMSYNLSSCRNHFTPGQTQWMADHVIASKAHQRAASTLEYSYQINNTCAEPGSGEITFQVGDFCVNFEEIIVECSNCPSPPVDLTFQNLDAGDYNFTLSSQTIFTTGATFECPLEEITLTIEGGFDFNSTEIATTGSNYNNQELSFDSHLIIPSGVNLTISNSTLSFDDDAGITIEQGGSLTLDNTILKEHICTDSWLGIEVLGTPGEWQGINPQATSPFHGLAKIIGDSEIRNAEIGITNAERNANINAPFQGGGKIYADDANFINCKEAVRLAKFKNVNNNISYPVHAKFFDTDFSWDEDFGFSDFSPMVRMLGVENVEFKGCRFNNILEDLFLGTNNVHNNAAIYMNSSSIDFSRRCQGTDCATVTTSSMTGFNYGIVNLSKIASSVTHTDFRNYRSIWMYKNVNSRITENTFNNMQDNLEQAADSEPVDPNDPTWQVHYGVYLENSYGFWVEENSFYFPADNVREAGIIVRASGETFNEIYRNDFNKVYYSIIAYDDNRSTNFLEGLKITCNEFENGYNDILVDHIANNPPGWGISLTQGSSQISAGNKFNTVQEFKLDNFLDLVTYYRVSSENIENGNGDVSDQTVVISPQTPVQSHPCDSDIPKSNEQKKTAALNYKNQAESDKILLNNLVDGGDTEALTLEVILADYTEATELYYELMAKSPALSEKVMIESIEKEYTLPPALITLILQSNPSAAKSGKIQAKLDDRMIPLSEYQRYMIDQGKNLVSEKEYLEAKISTNEAKFVALRDQSVNNILFDGDILDKETAIADFISGYENISHYYARIDRALSRGDVVTAQSVLSDIPNVFDLNDRQDQEWNDYNVCYQILIDHENNGNLTLSSSEISDLEDIGEKEANSAAGLANVILETYDEKYILEGFIVPGTNTKSLPRTNKGEPAFFKDQKISIYPNPANDYVVLEFIGYKGDLSIHIIDQNGKKMHIDKLNGLSMQEVLDIRDYTAGIYQFLIFEGDAVIHNERVVIN